MVETNQLPSLFLLSNWDDSYKKGVQMLGDLAQLVEHLICIQRVRSSSLLVSILCGCSSVG
jgi:hypothetical protein